MTLATALEDLVNKSNVAATIESKVYVLSEVGFDTAFFNPIAWENALEYMAKDPDTTGLLLDGAITRLDRPEYLCDALTYWESSDEECAQAAEGLSHAHLYRQMIDTQFSILEERLSEARSALGDSDIALSISSDDLQHSVSVLVNEAMLRHASDIDTKINGLKDSEKGYKAEIRDLKKKRTQLSKKKGTASLRGGISNKINNRELRLENIGNELSDLYQERDMFRVSKVHPNSQKFTRQFVEDLFDRYQGICDRYGVTLIRSSDTIDIGGIRIDYASSRHKTWSVLKSRMPGLVASAQENRLKLIASGVDVVLEGGHHGQAFSSLQRLHYNPSQVNFGTLGYVDQDDTSHVMVVSAAPFEDQRQISQFISGKESTRLSAGKPTGSRRISAMDRYSNGSTSGLCAIFKVKSPTLGDHIGTEWRQYADFTDYEMQEPSMFDYISASSDEHIGSHEQDPKAQKGMIELHRQLAKNGLAYRGISGNAAGFISGGDTGEANSSNWPDRQHEQSNPHDVVSEYISLLTALDPKDPQMVVELAQNIASLSMEGQTESMDMILGWVADYYGEFLDVSKESSSLRALHVSVPGNHADGVLRDKGLAEDAFFRERIRGRGDLEIAEVGVRSSHLPEDARVYLGGHSVSRAVMVSDYGMGVDGDALFGPVRLYLHHDPKGSGDRGIVGAGKRTVADLSLAGHTHETYVRPWRPEANRMSFAYRLATLEGTTATELKYAGGSPRTQAGHVFAIPHAGWFIEHSIPGQNLRRLAESDLLKEAATQILDGYAAGDAANSQVGSSGNNAA